ncbi:MAG: DUF5667 domain-containing protein [bacterium]
MKKKSFPQLRALFCGVIALFVIVSCVSSASAQTSTSTVKGAIIGDSGITATTTALQEQFQGIVIDDVTKMPSQWGLWWKSAKEKLALTFTFNSVKKAEKHIKFAEERFKYAEYILENSTDANKQEWAEKMIEKADQYINKVEENKDKWINNVNAGKRNILKNVATHQIRRENMLDRIEEKLPDDKLEKFREMREKSIEQHRKFMLNIYNNQKMPDSVKSELKTIKDKIEQKYRDIVEFQVEKRGLQIKAQGGDQSAKQELEDLKSARKSAVKSVIQGTTTSTLLKEMRRIKAINNPANVAPQVSPTSTPSAVPKPAVINQVKAKIQTKQQQKTQNAEWKVEQGEAIIVE